MLSTKDLSETSNDFTEEQLFADTITDIFKSKVRHAKLQWTIKGSHEKHCSTDLKHQNLPEYPGVKIQIESQNPRFKISPYYPDEEYLKNPASTEKNLLDSINFDLSILTLRVSNKNLRFGAAFAKNSITVDLNEGLKKDIFIVDKFYNSYTGEINLENFKQAIQEAKELSDLEKELICNKLFPISRGDALSNPSHTSPYFISIEEFKEIKKSKENKNSHIFFNVKQEDNSKEIGLKI